METAASLVEGIAQLLYEVDDRAGQSYALAGRFILPADFLDALARRLTVFPPEALQQWSDPLAFLPALGATVDSAMPWQPPRVEDALTGIPEIRAALVNVATGILGSPAAAWWGEDVDRANQWATQFVRDGQLEPLCSPGDPATRLSRWRQLVAADEARFAADGDRTVSFAKATQGVWWSMPMATGDDEEPWACPLSSTRAVGSLGAVALALQEDGWGDTEALLRRLEPTIDGRVYEVHSAADWANLVEQYPFDVSWSRRAVWGESTGLDAPWFIPDYEAVSRDFDAIHVSTLGYLTAAGEAIPVTGGATVLAGWAPDETYWLTDRVSAHSDTTAWHRLGDDMHEWTPGISPERAE